MATPHVDPSPSYSETWTGVPEPWRGPLEPDDDEVDDVELDDVVLDDFELDDVGVGDDGVPGAVVVPDLDVPGEDGTELVADVLDGVREAVCPAGGDAAEQAATRAPLVSSRAGTVSARSAVRIT